MSKKQLYVGLSASHFAAFEQDSYVQSRLYSSMINIPIVNDAPKIRAMRVRYVMAFVTVAATAFLLLSMCWPISVVKFRSLAVINAAPIKSASRTGELSDTDALTLLVECVRLEATPKQIDDLIKETAQQVPIRSSLFEYRDFASIGESIQVGVDSRTNDGSKKFILSFDGNGLKDEQRFLSLFSLRVANRLKSVSGIDDGHVAFSLPEDKLERAIWIANQIETDLEEVASRFDNKGHSNFQFASAAKTNSRNFDVGASLGSIETDSLKRVLNELKDTADTHTNHTPSLVSVNRISEVSVDAVGSAPNWSATILLTLFSTALAGVITYYFDPFGSRGFESVDVVASRLGLPVVATLHGTDTQDTPPSEQRTNGFKTRWANHVVDVTTIVLLALMSVVVGFVLIDETVRESFFYHPYDGLTRIVRIFMGY